MFFSKAVNDVHISFLSSFFFFFCFLLFSFFFFTNFLFFSFFFIKILFYLFSFEEMYSGIPIIRPHRFTIFTVTIGQYIATENSILQFYYFKIQRNSNLKL